MLGITIAQYRPQAVVHEFNVIGLGTHVKHSHLQSFQFQV